MSNGTYMHGLAVAPISAWLVWRDRASLAGAVLRPHWPGLVVLAGAGTIWLLSELALINVGRQFALVAMIPAAVLTILGRDLFARIAFPLLFLLFAVPVGDFLLPTLMDWTADFTVAALRATGVPVFRDGAQFVIPSGSWSVVEACSGLRYLAVSVMAGTLFAFLVYTTPWKRGAFIAAAVAVPVVGNWIRAYVIVMLGHLSSNDLATGVDHFIYGWVFFGIVTFPLFWLGARWREQVPPRADVPHHRVPSQSAHARRYATAIAAASTLAAAGVWQPTARWLDSPAGVLDTSIASIEGSNGWTLVPDRLADWTPAWVGYRDAREQVFEKNGRRVAVYAATYQQQRDGRKLVSSSNLLVTSSDSHWRPASRGSARIEWSGMDAMARRAELIGPNVRLAVVHWYVIDGHVTSDDRVAKLLLVWNRLRGRSDLGVAFAIYTEISSDDVSRDYEALTAFARDMGSSVGQALP